MKEAFDPRPSSDSVHGDWPHLNGAPLDDLDRDAERALRNFTACVTILAIVVGAAAFFIVLWVWLSPTIARADESDDGEQPRHQLPIRPAPACAKLVDVYALAMADMKGDADWDAMFAAGKCAQVAWPMTIVRMFDDYKDSHGRPGLIGEVLLDGIPAAHLYSLFSRYPADWLSVTYKPEYDKNSPVMKMWFELAELTPEARLRFSFQGCCKNADRFKTKFHVDKINGDDSWCYVIDDSCLPIPADVIHSDEINWPPGHEDEDPEGLRQLRAEGVLFLHFGKPVCFWPPESGQ